MLQLELKALSSDEVDLRTWHPDDPSDVFLRIVLEIGTRGSTGADLFYATAATYEGYRRHAAQDRRERARTIFLDQYSYAELSARILSILAATSASDWIDAARQLGRHFDYEYANHRA